MWTQFMDMHSGGGQKLDWAHIFIEAPEAEAIKVFYNRFGRSPHRVTCTCCGPDYSISTYEDLAQATAYERRCKWDKDKEKYIEEEGGLGLGAKHYKTLDEFLQDTDYVRVIYAKDILREEKTGHVPDEGYVWAGG
jgi:hypothetical protein